MNNFSPTEASRVATAITKYRKDFRVFASEQLYLGNNPIKFWPCQLPLIESIEKQFAERGFVRSVWLKARQVGSCVSLATRVLTNDLRWIAAGSVSVGDRLMAVDEDALPGKGQSRRLRSATVVAIREVYEPAFQLVMDNGEVLIATGEHRFLWGRHFAWRRLVSGELSHRPNASSWQAVQEMRIGDAIRSVTRPWGVRDDEDGWLAGILDGEGSFRPRGSGGAEATITQAPGVVLETVIDYLKQRGYTFRVDIDDRPSKPGGKFSSKPICKIQLCRMGELFRLLGQTRPCRFTTEWWEGKALPGRAAGGETAWSRIMAIIPLGSQRMIDLQTTTGTFIAEGFVSHNSTLAQCFVAWRTMLWPNVSAIVIADEGERARTLFEISRGFYDHMDEDIRPVGRYVTKKELVFANPSHATRANDPGLRSRIVVDSAHKKNIAIGSAWTVAHLSEAARFRDPNFVLDGVIPAVHRVPGTMIIIESSAEMAGTWYRDFCEEAAKGRNAFHFQFVPWYLQPEYFVCPVCHKTFPDTCIEEEHVKKALRSMDFTSDERHLMAEFGLRPGHVMWMREKFSEFGNDWNLFRQNYPITPEDAWVTPGAQTFPAKQLKEIKMMVCSPIRRCEVYPGPRVLDSLQGRLQVWKEPEPGKSYDIGVDIASGAAESEDQEALDNSVACVLERGSNDQVAEWCSKAMDAYEMATMLYWLGLYYNTAQVAIETNAIGGATNAQLAKIGYPNMYLWRYRDEIVPRYSKKTGWECVAPESKILTTDLKWVAAKDIKIGDKLIGCKEWIPKGKGSSSSLSVQTVIDRSEFTAPMLEVILNNGQKTKVSNNHPFLITRKSGRWPRPWEWVPASEIILGDVVKCLSVWDTLRTYEAGRLSAFLDGEGHLYHGKGESSTFHMQITQAEGALAQDIFELWAELGFDWVHKYSRHKGRPHEKTITTSGVTKTSEVLHALGSLRPTRLLRKFKDTVDLERLTLKGIPNATVTEVKSLGTGTVIGLTTGPDHTLIADGIIGHNTNIRSKPWLVGFAVHEMINGRVKVHSELLHREMEMFVQKGPREWGAVAGCYDDRVMAWMIALLASDDECFERYYGLRKSVDDATLPTQNKRKPNPWEADLTFLKNNDREDEWLPWEEPRIERSSL